MDNDIKHRNRDIVADDCYDLLDNKRSREYALAGLDDTNGTGVRQVHYARAGGEQVALVGKGLILVSNVPLSRHSNAVLTALEDRVLVIEHDPTDAEILALCRHLAKSPHLT